MHRGLIGLLAALVLAACSPTKDIAQADTAIADFHKHMNAADFDGIYAGASPDMKQSTTPDALDKLLEAVHRKLGDFRSGSTSRWNDNVATGGHFLTIAYAAKYEKGDAEETFVFRLDGDRASLSGYHVSSNA